VSIGIYNDSGPDHIACANERRQMSWTVGQMDGQAQERPEHRTEKCLEWNWLEERKWLEKWLEQEFP
jgi:hypothetical protein